MTEIRQKIIDVFKNVKGDIDFEGRTDLVDSGVFNSFEVIEFVSDLGDELDLLIPVEEIIPSNFNSLDSIEQLVMRLLEE